MKRLLAILVCFIIMISIFPVPASAVEKDDVVISQTVNYISDDCYFIETITVPSAQPFASSRTGTKTAVCVSSGTAIFTISVTGTFTFDGSTSTATSASGSISAHVEGVTLKSRNAYTSGSSAIATCSVVYYGITLQKTVTLTCDKDGNLS